MRSSLKALFLCIFFIGCKKDDPSPPGAVLLIAPAKNVECSPVDSSNRNTNLVEFSWQPDSNTDSYQLRIRNLNSGTSQTKTTNATAEIMPVTKGEPFSWSVSSSNTEVDETAVSERRFFFSPGSELSYAPFPAEITKPNGPRAIVDTNSQVVLEWTGADIDNDIESYEIYFDTVTPPALFESRTSNEPTTIKVAANPDTDYYWKVVTIDSEGNTSDTGILSFKAI